MCLEAAHKRIRAGLSTASVEVLHSYLTERYQRKKMECDNVEVEGGGTGEGAGQRQKKGQGRETEEGAGEERGEGAGEREERGQGRGGREGSKGYDNTEMGATESSRRIWGIVMWQSCISCVVIL